MRSSSSSGCSTWVATRSCLMHDQATCDIDGLTCHVISFARGEEAYDVGHVLGLLGTAKRDRRDAFLPVLTRLLTQLPDAHFAIDLFPHLGVHQARADAVHAHALFAYAAARLRVRLI